MDGLFSGTATTSYALRAAACSSAPSTHRPMSNGIAGLKTFRIFQHLIYFIPLIMYHIAIID